MEQEKAGKSGLITVQFHPQETFVQSWNVNDRSLIESKEIDRIDDLDKDWKILKDAIDGLRPRPSRNVTVMLITNEWSNTKNPGQIEEISSTLSRRLNHPVEVVDADEMAAVTTWEAIGADLPEKEQFKWVKRSRVVCLGIYNDHTGIALVESGRIIGRLSLPQESYPWSNIMLRNLQRNGVGFHQYLIRSAVKDYVQPMYSPDVTVVYIDDPTVQFEDAIDDPKVRVIGERDEHDKRADAGYGALLHWIKEQIGWRAFFIDDAIREEEESQDIVSLAIGGDDEDEPDLMTQIRDMMVDIEDGPDDEDLIDLAPITIPSPKEDARKTPTSNVFVNPFVSDTTGTDEDQNDSTATVPPDADAEPEKDDNIPEDDDDTISEDATDAPSQTSGQITSGSGMDAESVTVDEEEDVRKADAAPAGRESHDDDDPIASSGEMTDTKDDGEDADDGAGPDNAEEVSDSGASNRTDVDGPEDTGDAGSLGIDVISMYDEDEDSEDGADQGKDA